MNAVTWEDVKKDFEPDGALRDIYVENTTLADWDSVLTFVGIEHAPPQFSLNGEPAELPQNAKDIFSIRRERSPLMKVDVGGIALACHFFAEEEIEFDLVPTDVDGPARLGALLDFLRRLALLTSKPVLLTPENYKDATILRVSSNGEQVEYLPPRLTFY